MIITITANDGKVFKGDDYLKLVDECKAYESELALKKAKEEEERKAKAEKEKKLSQFRATKLKDINNVLQKAKTMVDEFEKETGHKLTYDIDLTTGNVVIKEVNNTLDFAFNDFYDDFLTLFSKNHR